ncbi:unnamed protein product [Mytilus edulis]|uniref:PiggyBac transposable element-derived protein domain-containing protein n=1 Tax=Mytilus edulis TaxID=6550 RepID=A0A8S3UNT3_MYTED|nr:unnamed protein product [Mytilus edulis]
MIPLYLSLIKSDLSFDSAATTCKTIIEEQTSTTKCYTRINVTNEDGDLSVAIAAVVPNIEDEVNNLSACSQDTIIMNMDDTIPYGMDDTDDNDVLDDSLSDHSNSDGIHLSSDDQDDISDGEEQAVIPHESDEEKEENPQIDLHPGFSMSWDNVGKKVTSRHPSETSKNKYLNMALGYIAINGLQTIHLNWKFDEDLKKAAELPSNIFVPNKNDFELLSNRMNVMVGRIITRYLPWFNANFSDCVTSHMLHEYSLDSSKRSALINL